MKVLVNGKPVETTTPQAGYLTMSRKWKSGDVVTMALPMETKAEYLPDRSPWVSFVHGPIVLAAITDTTDMPGLLADDSRMGHIANGPLYPLEEAPVLVSADRDGVATSIKPVAGKPLTFSAASLIDAERYRNVELVPFYQRARCPVHDVLARGEPRGASEARKEAMQQQEEEKAWPWKPAPSTRWRPASSSPSRTTAFRGSKPNPGCSRIDTGATLRAGLATI